ncbi:hypothetical protein [Dokdonia sp. Hel_I_53]|uniref:hypothetical protein n=1 Tax=Dokdonia sp. Hel_I_53 TaxID=1566287 RepID=UPI0011A27AE9|nr:hypothetical protein [Dokdonia sp. Hel_I_53]
MKNYIVLIMYLFVGFSVTTAQTYSSDTDEDTELSNQELIQKNILQYANLSDFGIKTQKNLRNETIEGNSVFITQIGELNAAAINVKSEASEIKLVQDGDQNFAGLDYVVKTVITEIQQKGNRNTVFDIINNEFADISLDLEQQGNDLNFQRLGSNSLTESLQFVQTQASPSLIIRSKTYGNPDN